MSILPAPHHALAYLWFRFTYLGKADRERCFTAINEMKSLFRWMLSGTPKHSNFNDISSLASLLGVRLGVDEVLPGAKLSKANLSESTGLESLSSYMESRSMQVGWGLSTSDRRRLLASHPHSFCKLLYKSGIIAATC